MSALGAKKKENIHSLVLGNWHKGIVPYEMWIFTEGIHLQSEDQGFGLGRASGKHLRKSQEWLWKLEFREEFQGLDTYRGIISD